MIWLALVIYAGDGFWRARKAPKAGIDESRRVGDAPVRGRPAEGERITASRATTYSPVRVSMRRTSPSLMNKGTLTTAPVSSFAGFWPPVAVSPRRFGSVSTIFRSMCSRRRDQQGLAIPERHDADDAVFEPLRVLAQRWLGGGVLLEVIRHHGNDRNRPPGRGTAFPCRRHQRPRATRRSGKSARWCVRF